MTYNFDAHSVPHSRNLKKPNEDFFDMDVENNVFIILDGVTRPHSEYEKRPFESDACVVNEIFSEKVLSYINVYLEKFGMPEGAENICLLLKKAVLFANESINSFRKVKSLEEWGFYPSTLGIVAMFVENRLYYASLGDGIGVLLRNNSKIIFGREHAIEAVDTLGVTKRERYEKYCNHPENPLFYSVFNGDEGIEAGLEVSFIDISKGDVVLLATDGMGRYVRFEKGDVLKSQSAREMIEASSKYDVPPYAGYADDKTIIKVWTM